MPAAGSVLLVQPIAILSNCKNITLAKAFLDYMYTEKAMRDMSSKGYVSALPGTSEVDVEFQSIKLMKTDWDYIDKNRTEMIDKFMSLFE
jgi:ABC-type Fe3+ transport system substrate-binding protein